MTFGVGRGEAGQNVTLRMLIALAYRVEHFQISGGPDWAGSERFDVRAKAEDPAASLDQCESCSNLCYRPASN